MNSSDFKPYLYSTLFIIGKEKFMEAISAAQRANARCRPCYLAKTLKNMRDACNPSTSHDIIKPTLS